jgi:hypothetical protein
MKRSSKFQADVLGFVLVDLQRYRLHEEVCLQKLLPGSFLNFFVFVYLSSPPAIIL